MSELPKTSDRAVVETSIKAPSPTDRKEERASTPVAGQAVTSADAYLADTSEIRSDYLVSRLFETADANLFNHVKFNLVNDQLDKLGDERFRVMDIGCGLQVARRYLSHLRGEFPYFGVDYESAFKPDAVVDLNDLDALQAPMDWQPEVVLLLDVLEHLHEDIGALKAVIANIHRHMPSDCTVIITLPQMYRLDRFKLPHLHYPEHKIRLTQAEWREALETCFDITHAQGLGYLSVLPYLPMALKSYTPENRWGRLFQRLRGKTFEWGPLKPLDLFLSRTLGRFGPLQTMSNDILFVARPR